MTANDITKESMRLATALGARLFRNNTGRTKTADGKRWIQFGIPSTGGGSDLLGWTPTLITADMVGSTVAVFTAVEIKAGRDRLTLKQKAFIAKVKKDGGIAGVARSVDDAGALLKRQTPPKIVRP